LAERTGRHLDSRREPTLGVPRSEAALLPDMLDFCQR
jgi:hypothetical protein